MFVNVLKRETGERRFILFSVLLLINGLFFLHVQAAGEQTEKFVPKLSIRQEFNAPENVNVPVDSTFQYQLEGVTGTEPLPGGAQGACTCRKNRPFINNKTENPDRSFMVSW